MLLRVFGQTPIFVVVTVIVLSSCPVCFRLQLTIIDANVDALRGAPSSFGAEAHLVVVVVVLSCRCRHTYSDVCVS